MGTQRRDPSPENNTLESPEPDADRQQLKSEFPESPEKDEEWIIPTGISQIARAYRSVINKIIWYNWYNKRCQEPWFRAGRRNMGNVDVISNAPVRTRAHYDPYIPINTIDRRILTRVEVARYGSRLRGNVSQMGHCDMAIIHVPWRHAEVYPAHAYVNVDIRIRRNLIIRKVRLFIVENEFNRIIFGEEFGRKYLQQITNGDQYMRLEDNGIQIEIPSTRKTFMPRAHICTTEDIQEYQEGRW